MSDISEIRRVAKVEGVPWTDDEDRIIWPFYQDPKAKPPAAMVAEALQRRGFERTPVAVRSRAHKLRKWRYGDKLHVIKLANNLPWR